MSMSTAYLNDFLWWKTTKKDIYLLSLLMSLMSECEKREHIMRWQKKKLLKIMGDRLRGRKNGSMDKLLLLPKIVSQC